MARLDSISNPLLYRGRMIVLKRGRRVPDTEAVRAQLDQARERSRASTSSRLNRMHAEGAPLVSFTKRCSDRAGRRSE